MKKKVEYSAVFFRRIPRDAKDMFKAACAKRGETMQDALLHFMEFYIQQVESPNFLLNGNEMVAKDRLKPMRDT